MEVKDPFALDAIPRRVMPLIFVVDTSGSMAGEKIASVNTAVRETLNDVGEISKNNADAQIKVAALQFSSGAQWMYPQPMQSETFKWQDLEASGITSLGAAYAELNEKLSRSHGFMAEPTGSRAPAIILLTDDCLLVSCELLEYRDVGTLISDGDCHLHSSLEPRVVLELGKRMLPLVCRLTISQKDDRRCS